MSDQTKAAMESKRVQTLNEKCDFFSFSNFTGHVMDWGVKMIITKVITPVQLLSYISILVNISEEYGGTKTAYYYDLLARRHMAKTLQSGSTEVKDLFLKVDNLALLGSWLYGQGFVQDVHARLNVRHFGSSETVLR